MKTFRTNIYTLVGSFLLSGLQSCSCPPNVELGIVSAKKNVIPYREGTLLTFVNAGGATISLKDTLDTIKPDELITATRCDKSPWSGSYYYYTSQNARSLTLKPTRLQTGFPNYAISINHQVINQQEPATNDTVFFEKISVNNQMVGGNVEVIIDDRGNRAKFSVGTTLRYLSSRIITDTVLNNAYCLLLGYAGRCCFSV